MRGVELAVGFQLGRAVGAARDVLFQFVTSVVRQLVVDMQQNIFLYPFAFHWFTPGLGRFVVLHRMSASEPRNFWVARNKVFFAVSSVVFKISPTVRNFNP